MAKKLTQFSPGKNEYGKPSTAVKIGFCLKGAVEVLIGQTLMNDDDLAERNTKKFLELLEKNWKSHVSVSAHSTIQEKRWNKQDDIPLTKNVMALRGHLRMVEDKTEEELKQQLSLTTYKKLNKTVRAQVIIFNKRHEGEASHLRPTRKQAQNPVTIRERAEQATNSHRGPGEKRQEGTCFLYREVKYVGQKEKELLASAKGGLGVSYLDGGLNTSRSRVIFVQLHLQCSFNH